MSQLFLLSHFWLGPFSLQCLLTTPGVRRVLTLEGCGISVSYSILLRTQPGASALYSSSSPAASLAVQSMPIFWPGGSCPFCSGLRLPWCLLNVPLLNWMPAQLLIHSFIHSLIQSPVCQMQCLLVHRADVVQALPVPLPQARPHCLPFSFESPHPESFLGRVCSLSSFLVFTGTIADGRPSPLL